MELPPELIDIILEYVTNKCIFRCMLTGYKFHVLSEKEKRMRRYQNKCIEELTYDNDLEGIKFVHKFIHHSTLVLELDKIKQFNRRRPTLFKGMLYYQNRQRVLAINIASERGYLEVMKYLCEIGKECTIYALDTAMKRHDIPMINFIHARGIRCSPWTLLKVIELLIRLQ